MHTKFTAGISWFLCLCAAVTVAAEPGNATTNISTTTNNQTSNGAVTVAAEPGNATTNVSTTTNNQTSNGAVTVAAEPGNATTNNQTSNGVGGPETIPNINPSRDAPSSVMLGTAFALANLPVVRTNLTTPMMIPYVAIMPGYFRKTLETTYCGSFWADDIDTVLRTDKYVQAYLNPLANDLLKHKPSDLYDLGLRLGGPRDAPIDSYFSSLEKKEAKPDGDDLFSDDLERTKRIMNAINANENQVLMALLAEHKMGYRIGVPYNWFSTCFLRSFGFWVGKGVFLEKIDLDDKFALGVLFSFNYSTSLLIGYQTFSDPNEPNVRDWEFLIGIGLQVDVAKNLLEAFR